MSPSHPTLLGRTILGAADHDDGAERGALKGKPFDIGEGERVTVVGVLRVIDHPPCVVNRQFVLGWTAIRVQELWERVAGGGRHVVVLGFLGLIAVGYARIGYELLRLTPRP